MAVQFFRRTTATPVSDVSMNGMSNDGIYLYSSGADSYMFYGKQSIAACPNPHYAFTAGTSNGKAYEFTEPFAFRKSSADSTKLAEGTTINVKFGIKNTSSSPTLNGVTICRRLSNEMTPITINAHELVSDTSYRLVYTKIGTTYYWVISGEKPAWSDLYGVPSNLARIATSTSNTTPPTTLSSGQLYIIHDN